MLKHLLLVFAVLTCSIPLIAQDDPADDAMEMEQANMNPESPYPWAFGFKVGTSAFGGDLIDNDIVIFNSAQPAVGAFLRRRISNALALRLSVVYGQLVGNDNDSDDPVRRERGFSSETNIIEPNLLLEFTPFLGNRYTDDYRFKPGISPYVSAGVGYGIWGDVETDYNEPQNDLAEEIAQDKIESADETGGLVIPLGIGLRYRISPRSTLGIDYNFRIAGTDLLDGVKNAGDPLDDDTYAFTMLTYSVGFGARDADKDGINDKDDECPSQPGPAATNGCPDADGDGVADKDDECPNQAGPAELNGCPDGDGDGIPDKDDECPTEPGPFATNGCPDADGDGIPDKDDECPDEAGLAEFDGCPDGDGDGIPDKDDECPAEPGPASTNGCPDRDGDGIPDKDDECPDEPGTVENNGCPDQDRPESRDERVQRYSELIAGEDFQNIRVDSINGTIEIDRIYFPTDVASLNRPDRQIIEEIERFLSLPGAEQFSIRYEGHADYRASDEYNMDLSQRRAQSAEDYAEDQGVPSTKLSTIGFGENQPVGETLRENRVVIPVAIEPTRMMSNE